MATVSVMSSVYAKLLRNSHRGKTPCSCWQWKGNRDPRGRYGRITEWREGKHIKTLAHRAMVRELAQQEAQRALDLATVGDWWCTPRPTAPLVVVAETVDHLCAVTWCIHPDHLEPEVTRAENTSRMRRRAVDGAVNKP